ncbi:hypothetical protein [Piscirickettsia litoralis]|uniref:FRG domain-containing protein n=1 Tax=Piscirickettsia litoralis TaxID=1891921 RepID=A0ABX2ZZF5_9GAMM|nr:hypothetical protein [Piscirickettsia litoralis]ODN41407.1 hypothetical protein BGC07_16715 [Piscirickettsia litoralis]
MFTEDQIYGTPLAEMQVMRQNRSHTLHFRYPNAKRVPRSRSDYYPLFCVLKKRWPLEADELEQLHSQWRYAKDTTQQCLRIVSEHLRGHRPSWRNDPIIYSIFSYAIHHYAYARFASDRRDHPSALSFAIYIDALCEAICKTMQFKVVDEARDESWTLDDKIPFSFWLGIRNDKFLIVEPYQYRDEAAIRRWLVDEFIVGRAEIIMKRFDYEKVLETGNLVTNIGNINREPLFAQLTRQELLGQGGRIRFRKLGEKRRTLDSEPIDNIIPFPFRD